SSDHRTGQERSRAPPKSLRVLGVHRRVILLAQYRHPQRVVVPAVSVELLAEPSLVPEPRLAIRADGTDVFLDDAQPDLVEVETVEPVEGEEFRDLGAVSLVPELLGAHEAAELRLSGRGVDVVESRVPEGATGRPIENEEDGVHEIRRLSPDVLSQLLDGDRPLTGEEEAPLDALLLKEALEAPPRLPVILRKGHNSARPEPHAPNGTCHTRGGGRPIDVLANPLALTPELGDHRPPLKLAQRRQARDE